MPPSPVESRPLRRRRWCCRRVAVPVLPSRFRCNEGSDNPAALGLVCTGADSSHNDPAGVSHGALGRRFSYVRVQMTSRYLLKCLLLLSALFCQQALFGQTGSPGTINTYAGNDALFAGGGQPATSAHLVGPNYIAIDGQGNVYFSASGLAMVR